MEKLLIGIKQKVDSIQKAVDVLENVDPHVDGANDTQENIILEAINEIRASLNDVENKYISPNKRG